MADELKIKLTVEGDDAKRKLEDAAEAVEDVESKSNSASGKFQRMAKSLGEFSPTFKQMSDKWSECSSKINEKFGEGSLAAKGFKVAAIAALVAIVAKAAKAAWQFSKETAKMFDPQGYSKAAGAAEKSMKRLKTAIGSFTAPLVNAVYKVFAKIVDGVTWVVEKVRIGFAYITGILKAVFEPVVNGIRSVVTWVQGAINAIGVFIGIGEVFKEATKDAEDAADGIGEVVEAASAGLASFDKLTTLDFSGMGDAEEADKISEAIGKAETDGKDLIKGINKWLENLDLGKVWDDFVKSCANAKDKVVEKLTEWFSGASRWASDMWDKFVSACGDVKNKIVSRITGWFSGASEWASGVWRTFVDKLNDSKVSVENGFRNILAGVPEIFINVWNSIKETFSTYVFGPIKKMINSIIDMYNKIPVLPDISKIGEGGSSSGGSSSGGGSSSSSSSGGSNGFGTMPDNAIGGSGIMTGVATVVKKAGEALSNGVSTVIGAVSNVGSTIANAASNAWNGFKGWLGLAGGGAVAPGNPQPYILGDNNREYEIVSPVSLMEQTVMSAMRKMGMGTSGQSDRPIEVSIELDGRKMARALYDPMETEKRRRGVRA